ncbi:MAG: lysophospholipid acyltransferase family protein [Pseudomonadota bacterium]
MNGVLEEYRCNRILLRMGWKAIMKFVLPDFVSHLFRLSKRPKKEIVCYARICNPIAAKAFTRSKQFEPNFLSEKPLSEWAKNVYLDLINYSEINGLDPKTGLCLNSAHEHGIKPQISLNQTHSQFYRSWNKLVPQGSELVLVFPFHFKFMGQCIGDQALKLKNFAKMSLIKSMKGLSFGILLLAACMSILLAATFSINTAHVFLRTWSRFLLKTLGCTLKLEGSLPKNLSGYIVAAQHTSLLDTFIYPSILPPRTLYFAKKELRHTPIFGFLLARLGYLFVERDSAISSLKLMENVGMRSKSTDIFFIHPQGTRRPDGTIGTLKSGLAVLAKSSRLPIVPITSEGGSGLWPKGKWLPHSGTVRISIFPEISEESVNQKTTRELTKLLEESFSVL